MPRRIEQLLERRANALEREGKLHDRGAYVYGTMARIQSHHHSPMPKSEELRAHMMGPHHEPADDDRRRNETSEENRHYWLHYGTSGRADHDHAGRAS